MAKGSQSQASVSAPRGGTGGSAARSGQTGIPLRGSSAATALRKRRSTTTSGNSSGRYGNAGNMLRFYTDDAPGLKITPTVVLVMSLCFIAFVTALHVIGKIYGHKS